MNRQQIGNEVERSTLFNIVADTFNIVADTVDFASVYGGKATRSILSTFNKIDRLEFNFVASVYRALPISISSASVL